MGKTKELSDEELLTLATCEFIQIVKQYRDGDENAIYRAKYPDILKKRGLTLSINREFIHRIFTGEFDNADGVEVAVKKVDDVSN